MEVTQEFQVVKQGRALKHGASLFKGYMCGIDSDGFWYSQGRCNTTPCKARRVQIFRQVYNRAYHAFEYRPFWEECNESHVAYLVREYMVAHPNKKIAKPRKTPDVCPIETRGMRMTKPYMLFPNGSRCSYAEWMKQG